MRLISVVAVMTNGNDGEAIVDALLDTLAERYRWPGRAPVAGVTSGKSITTMIGNACGIFCSGTRATPALFISSACDRSRCRIPVMDAPRDA